MSDDTGKRKFVWPNFPHCLYLYICMSKPKFIQFVAPFAGMSNGNVSRHLSADVNAGVVTAYRMSNAKKKSRVWYFGI